MLCWTGLELITSYLPVQKLWAFDTEHSGSREGVRGDWAGWQFLSSRIPSVDDGTAHAFVTAVVRVSLRQPTGEHRHIDVFTSSKKWRVVVTIGRISVDPWHGTIGGLAGIAHHSQPDVNPYWRLSKTNCCRCPPRLHATPVWRVL